MKWNVNYYDLEAKTLFARIEEMPEYQTPVRSSHI